VDPTCEIDVVILREAPGWCTLIMHEHCKAVLRDDGEGLTVYEIKEHRLCQIVILWSVRVEDDEAKRRRGEIFECRTPGLLLG
jgi:hypothetical protein